MDILRHEGNLILENSRRKPSGDRSQRRLDFILDTAANLLAEGATKAINNLPHQPHSRLA